MVVRLGLVHEKLQTFESKREKRRDVLEKDRIGVEHCERQSKSKGIGTKSVLQNNRQEIQKSSKHANVYRMIFDLEFLTCHLVQKIENWEENMNISKLTDMVLSTCKWLPRKNQYLSEYPR